MHLLRITSRRKKNKSPSSIVVSLIISSLFLLMNNTIITRILSSSSTASRKNIFVTSFTSKTITMPNILLRRHQSQSSKGPCNNLPFLKNTKIQHIFFRHTITTINSNRLFSSTSSSSYNEISSADDTRHEALCNSNDDDESTYHTPVMVKECIDALLSPPSTFSKNKKYRKNKITDITITTKTTINNKNKRKIFIDGTLGGGGHSLELLKRLNPGDVVFGCDVDNDAIMNASNRLQRYMKNNDTENKYPLFVPIQCNFCNVHDVLFKKHKEYFIDDENNTTNIVDGILLDLGISSYQIDTPTRGFTFMDNGPLDMRMSSNITLTASQICNEFSKNDLSYIFQTYGDESRHMSNIISSSIINNRPLQTTNDLVDAIYKTNKVPKYSKQSKRKGLSATSARIFQSLRIYINKEDVVLEKALADTIPKLLKQNGKLVILSYHSIEDRIVKRIMKYGTLDLNKNRVFGVKKDLYGNEIVDDVNGNKKQYKMIGKFSVPCEEEIERNVRARSAKLRIAEKL